MLSKKTVLAMLLGAGLVAVTNSPMIFAQESTQAHAWSTLVEEGQTIGTDKEKAEALQAKTVQLAQTANAFKGVPITALDSVRRLFVLQKGDPKVTGQWFVDWYQQNCDTASLNDLVAFCRFCQSKNYGPIHPGAIDAVAQVKQKSLKWLETDAWMQLEPQQLADMRILLKDELDKHPKLAAIRSQAAAQWLVKACKPDLDVPFTLNVASWLTSLKRRDEYLALTQDLEKHVAQGRLRGDQIPYSSANKLSLLIPVTQDLLFQTRMLSLWFQTGGKINEMSLVELASLKTRLSRMPDLTKNQITQVTKEIASRNSGQIKLDASHFDAQIKDLRIIAAVLDTDAKQSLRQRTMVAASPLLVAPDVGLAGFIQSLLFLKETAAENQTLAATAKLWLSGNSNAKIIRPDNYWSNASYVRTVLTLLPPTDNDLRSVRITFIDSVWENALTPDSVLAKTNDSSWNKMVLANGSVLDAERSAKLNSYILKKYAGALAPTAKTAAQTVDLLTAIGQFESAATLLADILDKNSFTKPDDQALLATKAASILSTHNKEAPFKRLAQVSQVLMLSQVADRSSARSLLPMIRSLINTGQRDKAKELVTARFKTTMDDVHAGINPLSLRETFELGVAILYCDAQNEGKIFPGYEGWEDIALPHLSQVDTWEDSEGIWAAHLVFVTPFSTPSAQKKLEAQMTSDDPMRRIMAYRSVGMIHKLQGNLREWQDQLALQSRLPSTSPDASAELMMARAFAAELDMNGRAPLISKDLIESALKTAQSPVIKFQAYRMLFYRYLQVKRYDIALSTVSDAEISFAGDNTLRSKILLHRRRAETLLESQAQYQLAAKMRNETLNLQGRKDLLQAQLKLSQSKGKSPEIIQKLEEQIQQVNNEITAMK